MIKKLSVTSLGILAICLCVSVVYAYTLNGFNFDRVGQYEETTESLKKGTDELHAYDFASDIDATLGLSLSKKGLFGYSFISRCNPSILGKTKVSCFWDDQAKGTYKGTVVFNTSNDGKPLSGKFFLKNS